MSDCSTNAWKVPKLKDREPGVIYMHQVYSKDYYEGAVAIEVMGVRFNRARECTMTQTYAGYPCADWQCSACGKTHNAPRANEFCPRCGAIVREVRRL